MKILYITKFRLHSLPTSSSLSAFLIEGRNRISENTVYSSLAKFLVLDTFNKLFMLCHRDQIYLNNFIIYRVKDLNEYIGNNNRHIILFLFTFLLGVFLHQSIVIHGLGNISIADGILVFTIICLSLCKRLNLPRFPVMAFIFFTSYILFVSFYFTPFRFSIEPNLKSFLVNYLKLLVLFLYLILGYNLAREKLLKFLIKIYSYTAFVISIIGLRSY